MILSIIIPIYNGALDICRCLDSIYSQELPYCEFEVICVDDCSSDNSVFSVKQYEYQHKHPPNLILIKHQVNKRAGGARNTGIRRARGKWILFIDHDDFFIKDSLKNILTLAENNQQTDFLMFDFVSGNGKDSITEGHYMGLNERLMTGEEFVLSQPVPWTSWCYIYKRERIKKSNLFFAENVRFEDADFVLKYTVESHIARFVPVKVVYHVMHPFQTTMIGSDKGKIDDFVKMSLRIGVVAKHAESQISIKAGIAIMKHCIFANRRALLQYLWRLPCKEIVTILHDNKFPFKTGDTFVDFTNQNANFTAIVLSVLAPLFHIASVLKHLLVKSKT